MNSLYDLDPKWKRLLSTNNFLGGLTVNEFVEELSKDQTLKGSTAKDAETWQKLDPKPYIRTFESILKELKTLCQDTDDKKSYLADEVSREELNHSNNIVQLFDNLKLTINNYDDLDNKLSNVIQIVSPLGEKVETAVKKKKNYIRSVELISYYDQFYGEGKSERLDQLLASNNKHNVSQAIMIVKNLLVLSRKIETKSLPKTGETNKLIEKYSETMENNLLESFNKAYRENNFSQLNEIALILNHFNGGVNVIQSFINQHSYFIDTAELEMDENQEFMIEESTKAKLLDEGYHNVVYDKKIVGLVNGIETVIKDESKIVKRVFEERAPHVLQLFIQRIYAQKIESKFENLLQNSFALSDLAHIRILHSLYSIISQFTKDLSEYFKMLELDEDSLLTSTLSHCFNDLFSRYLHGSSSYFEVEKRSLESILIQKTSAFNLSHEREIHLRSLVNKLENKVNLGIEFNELGNISRGKLSQINDFFKSHLDTERLTLARSNTNTQRDAFGHAHDNLEAGKVVQQDLAIDSALFNIENADSMLRCVVESIARVMELTPNFASDYTLELLGIMNVGIIGSYVETALELAYQEIVKIDVTKVSDINISFLTYISTSTDIISIVSSSVKALFLPLMISSPTTKKDIIDMTNKQIQRTELLINTIIEELTHLYYSLFTELLSKQKKKDFLPKSQDLLNQDTIISLEIVAVLNSLFEQSQKYLKGNNLTLFLTVVGNLLYSLLLSHYGKYQVNSMGGIIVTKDIISYQNIIDEWEIEELSEKFATLRELANLFTVQPELLGSLSREGRLVNLNDNIIAEYIGNRVEINHDKLVSSVKLNFKKDH
ncbi:hypothetical protein TPHA_0C02410 [Tetrapisispora phaffii CBS 4417]|uniref:Uncharacterized protein n=1 Tax=Tetrapisispora phaffii (strain ATCC 24235 / CBS 4417 / NBRC 1672 / NRRL Y-8282 / UCD 70-5) TaxID=1071381 RepID=G8BRL8_TETPH|nr:hypothetical protein TPHA_0C02410 [Tetrapisispora phaffii CBS 4417]CCE62394.1 hypothetical protein TPHA_0C02410 [Tetrapisispora phaffii CBS 4417]